MKRPISGPNRPRSGRHDPAEASHDLICKVAEPFTARDTVKSILNRATERLEKHGLAYAPARVERAWKRRAGWRIYQAIKQAFDTWQQSIACRSSQVDLHLVEQLAQMEEAVNASGDPDFYRPALEAFRAAVHARRNGVHPRVDGT